MQNIPNNNDTEKNISLCFLSSSIDDKKTAIKGRLIDNVINTNQTQNSFSIFISAVTSKN